MEAKVVRLCGKRRGQKKGMNGRNRNVGVHRNEKRQEKGGYSSASSALTGPLHRGNWAPLGTDIPAELCALQEGQPPFCETSPPFDYSDFHPLEVSASFLSGQITLTCSVALFKAQRWMIGSNNSFLRLCRGNCIYFLVMHFLFLGQRRGGGGGHPSNAPPPPFYCAIQGPSILIVYVVGSKGDFL
mmetsp:Transcript_117367/g.204395  ORF Transcript_117367/g.204395 Transcript_117367/m.204395 type:complete len:186 (-) Transcript_117367:91-648(-)